MRFLSPTPPTQFLLYCLCICFQRSYLTWVLFENLKGRWNHLGFYTNRLIWLEIHDGLSTFYWKVKGSFFDMALDAGDLSLFSMTFCFWFWQKLMLQVHHQGRLSKVFPNGRKLGSMKCESTWYNFWKNMTIFSQIKIRKKDIYIFKI